MRVDLPTPSSALAIGAHPDDIEFECGGALAKWGEAGAEIHLLVCTDGSKGTWDVDADTAALVERRRSEQIEAARRIAPRARVHFLDAVDGELDNTARRRGEVAKVIRQTAPDVVLGHDPWRRWRMHPDHRNAGWLTVDGVVAARDPHYHREHMAEGLSHHRPSALLLFECEEPNLVERIEPRHLEAKIDALMAHESQFETTMHIVDDASGEQTAAFEERTWGEARAHGRLAGISLGEAFRLMDPAS
ncbi:MAG: PIG-L deacetylase family protein [Acidimicrobiales bacterium]